MFPCFLCLSIEDTDIFKFGGRLTLFVICYLSPLHDEPVFFSYVRLC